MRLAWPSRGQPALAGRSRYRLSPSRSLRSVRLPRRTHPGDVSVPDFARKRHRSEGGRQLERPGPCLLDQPAGAGTAAAAGRRRAKPPRQPLSLPARVIAGAVVEILVPGKPYVELKKYCGTKVAVLNLPPRGATSSSTARR